MRGFYSLQPRIWRGEALHRANAPSQPDPYSRASPGYRERARETVTQIGLGMSRVDLGEPLKRLSCEPQAIPICSEAEPVAEPQDAPPVPAEPVAPVALQRLLEATARNWRADYGLLKNA